MKNNTSKILIILFTSDFYKYYYALNIASTYRATNIDVTLFYTGYAVNFLSKNWKDYDNNKTNKKLLDKEMPAYLEILNLCAELKIKFFFCNTALEFLNLSESDFLDKFKIKSAPLYKILNQFKNEKTIFI